MESFQKFYGRDSDQFGHLTFSVNNYLVLGDKTTITVEPRFNEPLYNEVLGITNDCLQPGQNYCKMYGTGPRYNEILVITNTIQKPERKIYLDTTNNEAMTGLRNFILSFDKTGSKEKKIICSLSSMEDTFLRMTIKREKQSSLKEFFKVLIRNVIVKCYKLLTFFYRVHLEEYLKWRAHFLLMTTKK